MFGSLAFWNEKRRWKKLSKSGEDLQNSLLFAATSSPGSQHQSWLLTANAAPWTPVSCHDFWNGRLSAFVLPKLLMAFSLRHARIAYAFQPSSCQNCWCPSAFMLPQLLTPFSLRFAKIADALQPSSCQNCWWLSTLTKLMMAFILPKLLMATFPALLPMMGSCFLPNTMFYPCVVWECVFCICKDSVVEDNVLDLLCIYPLSLLWWFVVQLEGL